MGKRSTTLSILIIFSLFLTSCTTIEEEKLLDYSNENTSYQITKVEEKFTGDDSLIRKTESLRFYDSKNRLINSDNNSFYFYNQNNKLSEIIMLYRREGKGRIRGIEKQKYIYNANNHLVKIIDVSNKERTVKTLAYDAFGNLTSETNGPEMFSHEINYEYSNGKVSRKTIHENNKISRVSQYKYDKLGRIIIEDWVFDETRQMRTYYTYHKNNKLYSERDSGYYKTTNPNQQIESLIEYYYDKNDSIIEIRKLDRSASEKEFKIRLKTKFEYKTVRTN